MKRSKRIEYITNRFKSTTKLERSPTNISQKSFDAPYLEKVRNLHRIKDKRRLESLIVVIS